MASYADVNPRIDPGINPRVDYGINPRVDHGINSRIDHGTQEQARSNAGSAQEQAANLAEAVKANAAQAYNSVSNSQLAQDLANGPAATSIKDQANATGNEFADLASSRRVPEHKAANDTPLTHYHSFFWNLLSWKNPRATGITFAGVITFIFACRYLPIIRLFLKGLWTVLGVVTLAETAAKYTIGSSVASSVRPRKYYKIPKETLEATLDDAEQFINFFVIEIQRIVFAENIPITAGAFLTALASYYLIKLLPAWGFALFATSVVFLTPLVYVSNKELIDYQIQHASEVVGEQTTQLKHLTAEHTSKGLESVKQYTGDYTALASEYIGKSRQKIPGLATNTDTDTNLNTNTSPNLNTSPNTNLNTNLNTNANPYTNTNPFTNPNTSANTYTQSDIYTKSDVNTANFPNAPRYDFPEASRYDSPGAGYDLPRAPRNEFASSAEHTRPIVYTADGEVIASSTR